MYITLDPRPEHEKRIPLIRVHRGAPSLRTLQQHVGGPIDIVELAARHHGDHIRTIDAVVNDEGLLVQSPVWNVTLAHSWPRPIAGPVVIMAHENGEPRPMEDEEVGRLQIGRQHDINMRLGLLLPLVVCGPEGEGNIPLTAFPEHWSEPEGGQRGQEPPSEALPDRRPRQAGLFDAGAGSGLFRDLEG